MWDLPNPGIKPMSPSLTGRFFTTEAVTLDMDIILKMETMLIVILSSRILSNFLKKYLFTLAAPVLCMWDIVP